MGISLNSTAYCSKSLLMLR